MNPIRITGAQEGNLQNISLEIPKNKLVVFTGLSGSGKSTLLIDVLFNECQRQYLEALSMEGIRKPKVERVQGASPAIIISQTGGNSNPRSTVGTVTDVYTDLRMVYEKLGVRTCPHCGAVISAANCREETEKTGSDFFVYMYCSQCGKRMDKLTRTQFSFNTKEGACPVCEGLGAIHTVDRERAVDESLALEQGAVRYWEKQYGQYQGSILEKAFQFYGLPAAAGVPVGRFNELQRAVFYQGVESEEVRQAFPGRKPPKTASSGKFEGVFPILWRRLAEKNGDNKLLEPYFHTTECPACHGERLCELSRNVTVNGVRLPQLSQYSLERLRDWVLGLRASLSPQELEFTGDYLLDMETKLNRFLRVGLGYLSLDRQTSTLSGGELQRLRLAAVLDSQLSGVLYILDEPSAGLHPKDTAGLVEILQTLRDLDNTVLVIEHDLDVMAAADHIVDMGPGSGKLGGKIVGSGTLEELKGQKDSVTGACLLSPQPMKEQVRSATGKIRVENADKFNLKRVSVEFPTGCITAVTGPSGSGKSTLIFEVLAKSGEDPEHGRASGLEAFHRVVQIGQSPLSRMKRSNVATYSGVYGEIRTVFAQTEAAKAAGFTARHFSFNTPGGRCENCGGLGFVENNLLFFANTEVTCPVCGGNRFLAEVLSVPYRGLSIKAVLDLTVDEALEIFSGHGKIERILRLLQEVGLGYLQLGQTLTTLSGGEAQRLKLAKELTGAAAGKRNLYLMDEPTTGLHPKDVEHFLALLDRLTEAGNTVIVVEHNQQLIRNSDWVVDLGPGGGEEGGQIIFEGTPRELKGFAGSVTAKYL